MALYINLSKMRLRLNVLLTPWILENLGLSIIVVQLRDEVMAVAQLSYTVIVNLS